MTYLAIITTTLASTVIANINKEILLVMHTYSTMILTMVMHLFTKINMQHCYIKSYKTPYLCLHDPITIQSYQISSDMNIETMLHAMYFDGNASTVTKINQVPYQTIQYNDKGMFPTQLMDDTTIQVFINNGATSSILPLSTYKKHPILQKYPTTKSTTPIHTEGGTMELHFWIELPLILENQTIQIKVLVCDSECPYDILLGRTSLAHLSAWQDYANNKIHIQQISIPIVVKNNVRILPGKTRIISTALNTGKTMFTPRITIIGKGIAYV